ncbi:transcription factor 25-like [Acanthaster planci]|uniref:Transcription factor 25-like n=1 Tax=Acanthaster planci TaxID=133434 RepID=A0A8B7ZLW2_ACAPL|nr:transcription factor 25-like [Acanthaster planci]
MSSRAMRKLHGDRSLDELRSRHQLVDEDVGDGDDDEDARMNGVAAVPINLFDLLQEDDHEDGSDRNERGASSSPGDQKPLRHETAPGAKRKKKRKKKNKQSDVETKTQDAPENEDEIDASVREVNAMLGTLPNGGAGQITVSASAVTMETKAVLAVEHKNLNADNEMRRIFGSNVVRQAEQRRRGRRKTYQRSTWLVSPKAEWPNIGKTGLSMKRLEIKGGYQSFTLEHSKDYQQVQFQFLDAVESLNPQNLTILLQMHPYHIDTLLQLSEVCKMSEDRQMAAELVERALYSIECSFHTMFSLTQGTCRLDYRRVENRAFFLALFRHAVFVGQRGANRTALELCKLILSLDPDTDPLGILLTIDHYALRSEQYQCLIRMYDEWEAHKNLSQLPNFAFSLALAYFHSSQDGDTTKADAMLQTALLMYPSTLMPLLDKCSIQPDATAKKHSFFSALSHCNQPAALNQLIALYIGRNYAMWKVPEVMKWLEVNVRLVLERVDKQDPVVKEYQTKRQMRYRGTPRNVLRHIILSEIKEAVVSLPPELANSPVLSYDPVPPKDSIISYHRPPTQHRASSLRADNNPFAEFFRSLRPSYLPPPPGAIPPEPADLPAADERAGAAGGFLAPNTDLRQSLGSLMDAMRDLLNSLRPPDAQGEEFEEEEAEEFD